jgi:hypothetical protein
VARAIPELHYRVAGAVRGRLPGAHRSRRGHSGSEFRAHAPLIDVPDVRRLDLHASLRDPFGQWLVRVNSERMAIPVAVVADLSASMGFEGAQRKLDVLADFVESLSWSAWRNGDSFGFVGCDEAIRPELLLPQTRARGGVSRWPRCARPPAVRHRGCWRRRHLTRQRSLLFLVSDFHLPLQFVERVLDSLTDQEWCRSCCGSRRVQARARHGHRGRDRSRKRPAPSGVVAAVAAGTLGDAA